MSTRAEYFQNMTDLQLRSPAMRDLGLLCHPKAPNVLAHIYYGLSEAYKDEFLYPQKRTDPTKQAAFTCAAIAVLKPLHPPFATIDREEFIYANQMFAMRCSCSIIEHPFHAQAFDNRRRFYQQLARIDLPSTNDLIMEAATNNGNIASNVVLKLTSTEEYELQALINQFVVLRELKIYRTPPSQQP